MSLVQQVRLDNVHLMLSYISRSNLADLVGVEYNQLNQYVCPSPKKSMGGLFASRIALGLNQRSDWLDVPRSKYEIMGALGVNLLMNGAMISSDRLYAITALNGVPFCDLNESEDIKRTDSKTLEAFLPVLNGYVFFKVAAPLSNFPFRHSIFCCSGKLVPGDQSIFIFDDGETVLGEFTYLRDGVLKLFDSRGTSKEYSVANLIYSSQITILLQSDEKKD